MSKDRSRGGWRTASQSAGGAGSVSAADAAPFSWITEQLETEPSPATAGDEKLSALDAGFLFLERPNQNFQIGFVAMLDGTPKFEELTQRLEERLVDFPRLRQVPERARLDLGWPVWRDDPLYEVGRHVHHIALPRPGDEAKLSEVLKTLSTTALLSDRPRWEVYLIEGLENGRSVLFCKVHHCMSDGIAGFGVLEAIADAAHDPAPTQSEASELPENDDQTLAEPTGKQSLPEYKEKLGERGIAGAVADVIADPRGAITRSIRDIAEAADTIASFLENPPTAMPWNGKLGQGRQVAWRSYPIDEFISFKAATDGTLNDVILSVVTGALRHYALEEGQPLEQANGHCIVPTSLREEGQEKALGNQVTAMFPRLPLQVADPVERLHRVREEMRSLKERKQARATSMVVALASALPSFTEASVLNAVSDLSLATTLCTNLPGPKKELVLCGHKISELHALAPLFLDVGVAFAITSYQGRISICIIADPALVPDAERIGNGLDATVYETRRALWTRSEALSVASRLARGPMVADLMAREVATVDVNDSLQRANEIMRGEQLSHLPVIDGDSRLIGVLTQKDLLFATPQVPAKMTAEDRSRLLGRFAVGRAVDEKVTTASPDEPALDAGKRMAANRLQSLPVVDQQGQLLGLVTENHIVRWTTSTKER